MRAKMLSSLQSATRVYIGDEGAQALASVLSQTSIHTLHLEGNSIRDAGAQAIAGVVSQTSINTLTVSYNRIGAAGAQALASVLTDLYRYSQSRRPQNIRHPGIESVVAYLRVARMLWLK